MQIIATCPPPHRESMVRRIASHPYVDALRFNTGSESDVSPLATLARLQHLAGDMPLWIDLKGRQLRIARDTNIANAHIRSHNPRPILLSHKVSCDLPATLILRNGTEEGLELPIQRVDGHEIYVESCGHRFFAGENQSVNIRASNLRIAGYLTDQDKAYIRAARQLGITRFMLSFVESKSDFHWMLRHIHGVELVLKIESQKGLALLDRLDLSSYGGRVHLMAARDDLLQNIAERLDIIAATRKMLDLDPSTIVASRIMTSLIQSSQPSLGDIADLTLLRESGCQRIMLCDELCGSDAFYDAMDYIVRWWCV